jgi:hypothetical protein
MTETIRIHDKFRNDAIACLVQLVRDESAPAASRASAATKILEYSVGRPVQAKAITVADIGAMTEEQRQELLHALVNHYLPGGVEALIKEAVDTALTQQTTQPKPLPFIRKAPTPSTSNNAARSPENAPSRAPTLCSSGEAELGVQEPLKASSGRAGKKPPPPNNIVPLHPEYAGTGHIHPSVLARSRLTSEQLQAHYANPDLTDPTVWRK